jgi:hypothetical protein
MLCSGSLLSAQAQDLFLSPVPAPSSLAENFVGDIKIVPSSAGTNSVSSYNVEKLENSYDGDYSTIYHSNYGAGQAVFPVTITYRFAGGKDMDYLIYYPRTDGNGNGLFKVVELWITTASQPSYKYGEYDFNGSSSSTRVDFAATIAGVTEVKFVVKSGGNNHVSCSEMEFYRQNPANGYDLFKDKLLTELRDGVTAQDVNSISSQLLRDLAASMLKGTYSREFRVGTFPAYLNLDDLSKRYFLTGGGYNSYENPTGIYFPTGKHIVVVDSVKMGQAVKLRIADFTPSPVNGLPSETTDYPLVNGVNIIDVKKHGGLSYIYYYAKTPETAPSVKVHFITGVVQGYFDARRHDNAKWDDLLAKAALNANIIGVMDAVGKHAQVTFPVVSYQKYAAGKGLELMAAHDTAVSSQFYVYGIAQHGMMTTNRIFTRVNYMGKLYRDGNGTSFDFNSMDAVCNPTNAWVNWGLNHEIGHVFQTIFNKWTGMTEITVNMSNISRGLVVLERGVEEFNRAYKSIVQKKYPYSGYSICSSFPEGTVDKNFGTRVLFSQLYYYFLEHEDMGANFYPEFHHALRDTAGSGYNSATWKIPDYEMYYIRKACETSGVNLLPFFEKWGFLYRTEETGITYEIDDYGRKETYQLSTATANAFETEINAKNYRAPKFDITKVKPNRVLMDDNGDDIP